MSTVDEPQLKQQFTLDGRKIRGPLTPLGNFVLVRTKETLDATEGGILLPDQVSVCTRTSNNLCNSGVKELYHA